MNRRSFLQNFFATGAAMALLADLPAGEEDAYGAYPEGSVNGKVMRRLERLAELWRRLHAPEE